MTLFARLYIGFQNRYRNLVEFFNQENKTCPTTLSDMGKLQAGSKSVLIALLKPSLMHWLLRLLSSTGQSLCTWWNLTLTRHLENSPTKSSSSTVRERQLPGVSRLDLVWDSYKDDIKRETRKRGCEFVWWAAQSYQETGRVSYVSTQTRMSYLPVWYAGAVLPRRGKRASSSLVMKRSSTFQDKKTKASDPMQSWGGDTGIMLRVANAVKHDHRRIQIQSVDADVVVLAVLVTEALPCVDKYCIACGMD